MYRYLFLLGLFFAAGCAGTKEVVLAYPDQDETIILYKANTTMNGIAMDDSSDFCHLGFYDAEGKRLKKNESIWGTEYDLPYNYFKTKPGKIPLKDIICTHKGFTDRIRKYDFEDLYFYAKPNTVNYLGDLEIEWSSEKSKFLDALLLGGLTPDKGIIGIKVQNNLKAAKDYYLGSNPDWDSRNFTKVNFASHPLVVQ